MKIWTSFFPSVIPEITFIWFLIYIPIHSSKFSCQEFAEYWIQEDSLDKEARSDDEQYFFGALDGQDYFLDAVEE